MKPSERHRVAAIDAEIDELLAQWRKLSKERSAITRRVSMRAYMRNRKAKESDMTDTAPDVMPCPWGQCPEIIAHKDGYFVIGKDISVPLEVADRVGSDELVVWVPGDLLDAPFRLLTDLVAELRGQNAHAGFERPDEEYVEVHLKAGDIRRMVAAVTGAGADSDA